MTEAVFKRLFHIPEMVILLSLAALACLPLALSNLVRDAGVSLLLPLTLIGALLTWRLVTWNVRSLSTGIILLVLGPLALFIRIGQMGSSLFEVIKQAFNLLAELIRFKTSIDVSLLLSARDDLAVRFFAMTGRLTLWFTGILRGIQIEDPVVRTLIWSLALWLIAVWAGWQIYRNKRLLAGMLPSTVVLAFVLDYTGKETEILWFHLALLLFLFGLTSYADLQHRWKSSKTDYSESTAIDTLGVAGVFTIGLVAFSFLSSTISVKDILEDLRDRSRASDTAQAETLGLESTENDFRVMGFDGGLPRSYLISAGPELSRQLAMTISTGDLPSMPESARPVVPRYYWRTITYQIYTGSGWANPPATSEDIPAEQSLFDASSAKVRIVNQEVVYPNDTVGRLYWTGTLLRADVPFQAAWLNGAETDPSNLLAALATTESYAAESFLLDVNANELRLSPAVYPDWVREQFLVLPDSVPERVRALARDLTASEPTPYDRAIAIQNYLREFPYTLEVASPPAGRDVADYFLFDLKQGYCDYYATTMIVLARAAGLPARLVVGYANGLYETEPAHYTVTENYAHSWVEVYFADIGWVEFEPTAGQSPIIYAEEGTAEAPVQVQQTEQPLSERFLLLFQRFNIGLPVLAVMTAALAWFLWDSLRFIRLQPAQAIQLLHKRLRRLARPVSGFSSMDQTAHQYASFLISKLNILPAQIRLKSFLTPSQGEILRLTELYSQSLFAPSPITHSDVRDALRIWSRLRWRIIIASLLSFRTQ